MIQLFRLVFGVCCLLLGTCRQGEAMVVECAIPSQHPWETAASLPASLAPAPAGMAAVPSVSPGDIGMPLPALAWFPGRDDRTGSNARLLRWPEHVLAEGMSCDAWGRAEPHRLFADAGQRMQTAVATDAGTPAGENRQEARESDRDASDEEEEQKAKAVEESIESLLPVGPEDVKNYLGRKDALEEAAEPGPARMHSDTRTLKLTPGAVPQVIRLTQGYSSTLLFLDRTGAPWPVLSVILGSARSYQVSQPSTESAGKSPTATAHTTGTQIAGENRHSHIVNLVPLSARSPSNLVVTLEDAPFPVVLHLVTESPVRSNRVSDSLIVFRVDADGPDALKPAIGPREQEPVSEDLLDFVHGAIPAEARRVRTKPEVPGTSLWELNGSYWLRTIHHAVWPAWRTEAGTRDVRVYVLPRVPAVTVAADGRRITLNVVNFVSDAAAGKRGAFWGAGEGNR